jgi:hypothetical protein
MTPEIKKEFFVTHVGRVSVNNYGAVEFETPTDRTFWHIDTLYQIAREVRAAVAEMRKEGVYRR